MILRFETPTLKIPTQYKTGRCSGRTKDGTQIRLSKHARQRFWERVSPGFYDEEIVAIAVKAYDEKHKKYKFRDGNNFKLLITVLP